mgnify:CR=1 FL=1
MSDAFEVAWRLTKESPAPSYHQGKNRGIENYSSHFVPGFSAGSNEEDFREEIDPSEPGPGARMNQLHGNPLNPKRRQNIYGDYPAQKPDNQKVTDKSGNIDWATPDNPGTTTGITQRTAYGDNRIVERMPRPDEGQEDSFGSRGYEEGMGDSAFQPSTDFSGNIPQPQKKGGMLSRFMRS